MIRVSGPHARKVAGELFDTELHTRGVYRARCTLTDRLSVPMMLLWYPAPGSYTVQDTLELILTGNPSLVGRVLDRLLEIDGVELAGPGEFSARAYLNHRLSIQQAEGIALGIAAENEEALGAARSLLDGSYGHRCDAWAQEIATLLALVEGGVDFSDQEDVIPIAPIELGARLGVVRRDIADQIGVATGDRVRSDLPKVVFVGQPNAGKSSLFNALLDARRSAVSDQGGTTRDAITERLDLSVDVPGAGVVELTDLAGIGLHGESAIGGIDAKAQLKASEMIEGASVLLWCDPDGRFDASGLSIPPGIPALRIRTKSDLPKARAYGEGLAVCAIDGTALGSLRRAIADAVTHRSGSGVGVFVPRHRRALLDSAQGIDRALARLDQSKRSIDEPELVALGLRQALDALGELIGEISPDDVLSRVFATFCVGK